MFKNLFFSRFKSFVFGAVALVVVNTIPKCFDLEMSSAMAGQFNEILSIGDKLPSFGDLPSVSGDGVDAEMLSKAKAVLVVFTCNTCPYAVDYEGRLVELLKSHGGGAGELLVVAVNSNDVVDDSLEAMQKRAKEKGFHFPYLKDSGQVLASKFGAARTPEFFLFDANKKLVYMGAFDDSPDAGKVSKNYVKDALQAVIVGKQVPLAETAPVGCRIRVKKARR